MTYLDANATEPARPEAIAAAVAAMRLGGNPSAIHRAGRAARRVLEGAREALAARFGAPAAGVVFTSGGTEANALAVRGLAGGRRVIIGATEHDAVRAAAPGAAVLPCDAAGLPDLAHLAALLGEGPALVCLMLANNETGTILPIAEAAALCRAAGALLHVDAVQAAGRIAVDFSALGAHSLALSGHKLGGIPGAGALLLAPGIEPVAQLTGGGQERGRRGGTHGLPAIAAMAAAAAAIALDGSLAPLRDAIERHATEAGAIPLAAAAPRLPNTASLALPGIPAATQVIALDLAGVQVSAGAACSSGKVAASHVLAAMGLGALAGQAIRVSLPWNATQADVTAFAAAYTAMAARLRQGRAA
jgi:cysteine desulfurase